MQTVSQRLYLRLQIPHPVQHMMNGLDSLDVNRQVVIHTCVLFQITELGREEIPLSIRDINVYQTSLFQQNDERRVYTSSLSEYPFHSFHRMLQ